MDAFRLALETASLEPAPAPATTFSMAARLWNEVAATVEGWPACTVEIAADPRRYSLACEGFTEPYRADLTALLEHGGNQDPLAEDYAPSAGLLRTLSHRRR